MFEITFQYLRNICYYIIKYNINKLHNKHNTFPNNIKICSTYLKNQSGRQ